MYPALDSMSIYKNSKHDPIVCNVPLTIRISPNAFPRRIHGCPIPVVDVVVVNFYASSFSVLLILGSSVKSDLLFRLGVVRATDAWLCSRLSLDLLVLRNVSNDRHLSLEEGQRRRKGPKI